MSKAPGKKPATAPERPEFEVEGVEPSERDGSLDGPQDDDPEDDEGGEDDEEDPAKDLADEVQDEDIDRIRQGTRALRWFAWPGAPGKRVAIRPLSRLETYQGAANARQALEDVGLDKDDVFEEIMLPNGTRQRVLWLDLVQRDEWLAVALRRGDNPKLPLFSNADEMRKRLTSQEIGKLYEVLADHMMQTVPLTLAEKLGAEEAWMEMVTLLKKKPEEILLAALPHGTLRELVIFMVEKLVNLPTTS